MSIINILIIAYILCVCIVFGYGLVNIGNFKELVINLLCSIFILPIILYYFLETIFEKCLIKDILWFIKLLTNMVDDETILKLQSSKYVINGLKDNKDKSFLYRYLSNKVIKKYNL